MVVFKATDYGFHFLSPLGGPLAPDVFLNAAPDIDGPVRLETAGLDWSGDYEAARGVGAVALVMTQSLDPADGPVEDAAISAITWTRFGDGASVEVGRVAFDTPLSLAPVWTPDGGATGGPAYEAEAAAALADLIRADGFRFEGGAGADVFAPGAEILPIRGPVEILGRGGDDILEGSRAHETLRGGEGDDELHGGGGLDHLMGGAGDDMLFLDHWSEGSHAAGGAGNDHLISSNGDDTLFGKSGQDRLEGGRGADTLHGGLGDDRLDGGEGDDVLSGGAGNDVLTGGWGADEFVFRAGRIGQDVVEDFEAGLDLIHLAGAPVDLALAQDGADTLLHLGAESVRFTDTTITEVSDALL